MDAADSGGIRRKHQVVLVGQPPQAQSARQREAPPGEISVCSHQAQFLQCLHGLRLPNRIDLLGVREIVLLRIWRGAGIGVGIWPGPGRVHGAALSPAEDHDCGSNGHNQHRRTDQGRGQHTGLRRPVRDQSILEIMQSSDVYQIIQTADHIIALNRQIDAFPIAVCIQPDDIALLCDQRAAGVAVIDVGVDLDHIGVCLRHVCQTGDGPGCDRDRIHIGGVTERHLVAGAGEPDGVNTLPRLRQRGRHEGQGHPFRDNAVGQKNGIVGIALRLVYHIAAHGILHIQQAAVLCLIPPVIQQDIDRLTVFYHMFVGHKDRAGLPGLSHGEAGAKAGLCTTGQYGQDAHHTVSCIGDRAVPLCPRRLGGEDQQTAQQHQQGKGRCVNFLFHRSFLLTTRTV